MYIGPSLNSYCWVKCYISTTRSEVNADTVVFFSKNDFYAVKIDCFITQAAEYIITFHKGTRRNGWLVWNEWWTFSPADKMRSHWRQTDHIEKRVQIILEWVLLPSVYWMLKVLGQEDDPIQRWGNLYPTKPIHI